MNRENRKSVWLAGIFVVACAQIGYSQQPQAGQKQQPQQPESSEQARQGPVNAQGQSAPNPAAQQAQQQLKEETAQQTNEKIQRLAALARARPVDNKIGAGDLLHIDVFDVPELTREVRVSQAGDLSYPLIPGKIPGAGLTAFQLEEKLEELLVQNGLVSHPQVSVFVKEQVSQPITVVGAVGHPLVYQAVRPVTLLEVLSEAGGIADTAGGYVTITRSKKPSMVPVAATSDGNTVVAEPEAGVEDDLSANTDTITVRLQDLLETGNPAFNIPVYGGDVIRVPRAGVIYALGAGISQPGGYVIQEHGEAITVLKLLALAHGLAPFSKPNDAVIMRNNPVTGRRDAIPVKIKQMENRQMEDVALQGNDILYVPDSAGKKALARGAEAAVGIGSSVILYRSINNNN